MTDSKYATPFDLLHAVSLLSQKNRIRKFSKVLEKIVKPNMRVADIGTGTGVLAMLAIKHGANSVTSIDVNQSTIEYAKRTAMKNGVVDKFEFVTTHYSDFIPEEKYDLVICEMLSSMMLVEQQIPASYHIRKHILKEDGILLPEAVRVYCILCQCDALWDRFSFEGISFPKLPQTISVKMCDELSNLVDLFEVDLLSVEENFEIDLKKEITIEHEGIAHGILGMFEATVFHETKLEMEDGWRELFLPFREGIPVIPGQEIRIHLSYTPGRLETLSLDAYEE